MNILVRLPLQESRVQRSARNHDQCPGYMTVLVDIHRMIKSISILTAVICPKIELDVDKLLDCFGQEVKLTLAIR